MINTELQVRFLEGQLRVYGKMKNILEGLITLEGLEKFDKKVINKRVKEFIRNYSKTNEARWIIFSEQSGYSSNEVFYELELKVMHGERESYNYRIDSETTIRNIPTIDNKRFDYEGFKVAIKMRLEALNKTMEQLENELNNIEEIVKEHEAIKQSIKSFNKKYSWHITQGLSFR